MIFMDTNTVLAATLVVAEARGPVNGRTRTCPWRLLADEPGEKTRAADYPTFSTTTVMPTTLATSISMIEMLAKYVEGVAWVYGFEMAFPAFPLSSAASLSR